MGFDKIVSGPDVTTVQNWGTDIEAHPVIELNDPKKKGSIIDLRIYRTEIPRSSMC